MSQKFEDVEPSGSQGRRITILSIDGGGVRGIIPATILQELEGCLQVLRLEELSDLWLCQRTRVPVS
jgi:patatin-like phospholipase/acyl hydrolase